MRATLASSIANLIPMQLRGPKPNGMCTSCGRLALSSGVNLFKHRHNICYRHNNLTHAGPNYYYYLTFQDQTVWDSSSTGDRVEAEKLESQLWLLSGWSLL
jgi:hypothetical protein